MASPNLLVSVSWHKYLIRDMERTPYNSCDPAEQDGTAINYRRIWVGSESAEKPQSGWMGKRPALPVAEEPIPGKLYTGQVRGGTM